MSDAPPTADDIPETEQPSSDRQGVRPVGPQDRRSVALALRKARTEVFPWKEEIGGSRQADYYFRRLLRQAIVNGDRTGHFCAGGSVRELHRYIKGSRADWVRRADARRQDRCQEYGTESGIEPLLSKWLSSVRKNLTTRDGTAGFVFHRSSRKGEGSDFFLYGWVKRDIGGRRVETPRYDAVPAAVRLKPRELKAEERERPVPPLPEVGGQGMIERNVEVLDLVKDAYRERLSDLPVEDLVKHDAAITALRRSGNQVGLLVRILGILTGLLLVFYIPFKDDVDAALTKGFEALVEVFARVPKATLPHVRGATPTPPPASSPVPTAPGRFSVAPSMASRRAEDSRVYDFRYRVGVRLQERAGVMGFASGPGCWIPAEAPGKTLVTFYTTTDDPDLHVYAFSGFRVDGNCIGGIRMDPITVPVTATLGFVMEGDPTKTVFAFEEKDGHTLNPPPAGRVKVERVFRDGLPFCRIVASAPRDLTERYVFAVSFGSVFPARRPRYLVALPNIGTFTYEKATDIFTFKIYPFDDSIPAGTVSTESRFGPIGPANAQPLETLRGRATCPDEDRSRASPPR